MVAALKQGDVEASAVSYVNLHGTGTPHNDEMEAKAVASVFGSNTPCSSTKPMVGHMLGASGATEIGFCFLALQDYLEAPEYFYRTFIAPGHRHVEFYPKLLKARRTPA